MLSFSAFGWGKAGHRIVGQIAQTRLSASAEKEIAKLIDNQSLAQVSVWPDFIKSDPEKWGKSFPWHYVNAPAQEKLKLPKHDNHILGAIAKLSQTLKNKEASKEERSTALKFIVHLVGDLHQPLHVGLKSDRGGNDFKVKWFGKKTNLHSVWDEDLIEFQELSFTEYSDFLERENKGKERTWTTSSPEGWAKESFEMRKDIYAATKKGADLDFKYNYQFKESLNRRLFQGGVRLADLLNSLL